MPNDDIPASDISGRLAELIAAQGPISIERYMAEANAHYYARRDPLGRKGDFITAPEISQMFGELIGAWLADLWIRAGEPPVHYVELGPGRGTLAADALRAMRAAGLTPPLHLVETSPPLRVAQAERLPEARWHDDLSTLPHDAPLLIVANEFFDALPIRQFIRTAEGWRERMVAFESGGFVPVAGSVAIDEAIPLHLRGAPIASIVETSAASTAIAGEIARRLASQGGAAIIIDYGHDGTHAGDTLQAVRAHGYADPFATPGASDLTAHIDFTALAEVARAAGLATHGPAPQGAWLGTLGIAARAAALGRAAPDRVDEIAAAHQRLTGPEAMGRLFRAMALIAPGWPEPAGF
jgi:SAM-dependent MidA family methyltransferase